MYLRQAAMEDLPQLKAVYKEIIEKMNEDNVQIWDDIYPCEFFKDDIENDQLYVLDDNGKIASAFALCDSNSGEGSVEWEVNDAKAYYIDRFGVNVHYLRKGIGGTMLREAAALAREKGAEYLRLFVVDINEPAINLYLKNGFKRGNGIYEERIDEDYVLREIGFEMKVGL